MNLHLRGAVQGIFAMEMAEEGYFELTLPAGRHCRYLFLPDGRANPYSEHSAYGRPEKLKAFVNAASG